MDSLSLRDNWTSRWTERPADRQSNRQTVQQPISQTHRPANRPAGQLAPVAKQTKASKKTDQQANKGQQIDRPANRQKGQQTDRLDKQTLTVACLGLTPVRASLSDTLEAVGRVAGLTAFHPIRQCCNTVIVHMLHYR